MGSMNFRDRYEFDPYAMEDAGGGGGLLGRWLALQAEQSRYQPTPANSGQARSAPQNPNFRQVSRAPIVTRPQGAIDPLTRPDDQSSQSYSPFGGGLPADVQRISDPGPAESGAHNDPQAPVIAGFPWIGRAKPVLPIGPGTSLTIPRPQLSEWWRTAQELLRLYGQMRYGRVGGGNLALPPLPEPAVPDWNELSKQEMASRKRGRRKGADGEGDPAVESEWYRNKKKELADQAAARRAAADKAGRLATQGGRDDENICDRQKREEEGRCYERKDEYAHDHFFPGCLSRAEIRRDLCERNGRRIPREPAEWGPADEDVYFETGR